ncbi:MAG: ThiF family adenylyltransferase [Rhodobacteraceae bacterium]|nr:ThiF family adenylyltransferase [Paracoccaceae bacterium]
MNATLDLFRMSHVLSDIGQAAETRWPGQQLAAEELRKLPRGVWVAGWRFRIAIGSEVKEVDLVFDAVFPWSAPRLFMRRPPILGTLPHLEADGFICAFPSRTPVDPANPVGIAHAYLKRLLELASDWSKPEFVMREISDEYLSYLGRRSAPRPIRSLLAPSEYSEPTAYVWRGRTGIVLSNSSEHLTGWLNRRYGRQTRPWRFERAMVLRPDALPNPQELPDNARELLDMAALGSERELLIEVLAGSPRAVLVAVALPTRPHETMIAYEIPAARKETECGRKHVTAGFRAKKMPLEILVQRRAATSFKVSPMEVERLDAAWVHGRDQLPEVQTFQGKTVTVLGCGSLGSGVTTLLAKAGVGGLNLVDPEIFASENISRHDLGISDVGRWKADALAEKLRNEYPHLRDVWEYRASWQKIAQTKPEVLLGSDIVLVAIGSWMDEGAFETWRLAQDHSPTTIYGWLEPHAVAAHAVSVTEGGPCFGCGLSEFGESLLRVASWPGTTTTRTHPACGGSFQPYGASQLARGHGLIADLCLEQLVGEPAHVHRIWSSSARVLNAVGGEWSDAWKEFVGYACDAGGEFERTWIRRDLCRICGGSDDRLDL